MKKTISILIIICTLTLCLVSCGECEHQWSEATCAERSVCTECGEIGELSYWHSYGEWITTKEATYKEDGLQERTCEICSKVETQTLSLSELMKEEAKKQLEYYHETLKSNLLNINSYTVNNEQGTIFYDKDSGSYYLMLSVDYSAQNKMGGYTRYEKNLDYSAWNGTTWISIYEHFGFDTEVTHETIYKIYDYEYEAVGWIS